MKPLCAAERRRERRTIVSTNKKFLLKELIKRDFIKKYKRTTFGILWSVLSPLLLLVTMSFIFRNLFGRTTPHYNIYLFSGLLNYNYFYNATNGAMTDLYLNADIYSKVPVPKTYFIFSHSVANLINYGITLLVFFIFVAADGISFHWNFLTLLYPIVCLYFINYGIGMFLSTLYIFFSDIKYLYPVICRVVMYGSAIFYDVYIMSSRVRRILQCNPIYSCIDYFRQVVIHATVPDLAHHVALAVMAALCMIIGALTYRAMRKKIELAV